jgi:hypothetical protein
MGSKGLYPGSKTKFGLPYEAAGSDISREHIRPSNSEQSATFIFQTFARVFNTLLFLLEVRYLPTFPLKKKRHSLHLKLRAVLQYTRKYTSI